MKKYIRMFVSLGGGSSQPYGDITNTRLGQQSLNPTYNIAGGASSGYYAKADFCFMFSKHFGITALGNISENKSYTDANQFIAGSESPGFTVTIPNVVKYSRISINYETTKWSSSSIFLGMNYMQKIHFLTFDFKLASGILQIESPQSTYEENGTIFKYATPWVPSQQYSYYAKVSQAPMITHAFIGNLGMEINYNFSKRFRIKLGCDLFLSKINLRGKQTITTSSSYYAYNSTEVSENPIDFKKNLFLVCINLGVSYQIK
jgi:hypothetical protein